MALAIDASTPAAVATSAGAAGTTLTTASFTPPLGSLLVMTAQQAANNTTLFSPSNTGGGVTWDGAVAVSSTGQGVVQIWRGVVTTSASMTVTCTAGTSIAGWGFGLSVWTGQLASQAGAATKTSSSASGAPTGTITALTGTNSAVLGTANNNSNGTGPTIPGTQSDSFNSHAFLFTNATTTTAGWAQFITAMNLSAGSSATINDTAPTVAYVMAILEILVDTGAAAPIPDLIMAPAHR